MINANRNLNDYHISNQSIRCNRFKKAHESWAFFMQLNRLTIFGNSFRPILSYIHSIKISGLKILVHASICGLLIFIYSCFSSRNIASNYSAENWNSYAGDNTKSRYSTLSQINTQNVSQLKIAWTYRSG